MRQQRSRWSPLAVVFALALTGLAACDNSPTSSTDILAPSYAMSGFKANGVQVNKLVTYRKAVTADSASAVFGSGGGRLAVGKNVLLIPRGAVDQNVIFSMVVVSGDTVHLHLSATKVATGQDFGAFLTPVTLTVPYDNTNTTDPTLLFITYLVDGTTSGALQPMKTTLQKSAKTVSAQIPHFSDYALGEN